MAVDEQRARVPLSEAVGLVIASVVLSLGTVALIWLTAVPFGSGVCPAIDPAPLYCSSEQRAGTGLVATICVLALGIVNVVLGLSRRRSARPFVIVGVVVLALAPFFTYGFVAWSDGFPLS